MVVIYSIYVSEKWIQSKMFIRFLYTFESQLILTDELNSFHNILLLLYDTKNGLGRRFFRVCFPLLFHSGSVYFIRLHGWLTWQASHAITSVELATYHRPDRLPLRNALIQKWSITISGAVFTIVIVNQSVVVKLERTFPTNSQVLPMEIWRKGRDHAKNLLYTMCCQPSVTGFKPKTLKQTKHYEWRSSCRLVITRFNDLPCNGKFLFIWCCCQTTLHNIFINHMMGCFIWFQAQYTCSDWYDGADGPGQI